MYPPLDIGSRLVRARRQLGVTQTELGRRVGVSQPQIARWEAALYRTTTLARVEAVAGSLGIGLAADEPLLAAEEPRAPYSAPHARTLVLARLGVDQEAIGEFCRSQSIVEFGVFGSVLGSKFGPLSDVDVLVRFADDARLSIGDLVAATDELSSLFGRDVDLLERRTVESMENYLRRRSILGALTNLYAA